MQDPAVQRKLADLGLERSTQDAASLTPFIKQETDKWARIIVQANAVLD
jgi:tripartite-type tricarboxylate transporter receptor subunit TctC